MLMNCIDYLNGIYRDSIKKEVVSSAGDEFQGLFLDLQSAFVYIRKLQILIYPIKIRCGIGYGEIKYDVEEWTSAAFDGEAYYLARAAIVSIGKQKNNAICFHTKSLYDKYLNVFVFLRYAGENKSITDCAAHRTCCRYYVTACLSGRR